MNAIRSLRSRRFSAAKPILAVFVAALLHGCSDNAAYETAVCALADVSGTYADQKAEIVKITKARIVSKMLPGDSLFFIRIDSNSYNEGDLIANLRLDYTPSKANQQKVAMGAKLDEFAEAKTRSRYTDISGAMMLCTDHLNSTKSGNRVIFVFSDMKEELQPNVTRQFAKDEFDNVHIAAMNVIKLNADSANPAIYRNRLDEWEKRIMNAGAQSWGVFNDSARIPEYIQQLR
ncbi:hypothetical protein FKG94_12665 [Exilibacterium tricleocarpae]|uniref:VWA domain-containing protein n=1 Tax=Exilibacterium tricleocarpae TaxID=2591008 RepID=A0A545TNR7_9GAMM|nr:hypothetical protein [Exilibacterium tricleocarpae]TQV78865.1 hypothetical protein FKG94_12665 [Exilibacterium tricleocarpae]